MADIKRIRAALANQGDRLQKLPRQAVWIVHRKSGKSYRLTYLSIPLNAWALYPTDREASELLCKIERALNSRVTAAGETMESGKKYEVVEKEQHYLPTQQGHSSVAHALNTPTTYSQQLHPWCIVQHLPQMQRRVVARFRRRNDADAHMKVLYRLSPLAQYSIIFDMEIPIG
ncbi:hypothetical protein [Nodosilinea sp. E11]|uniref:hypothetical protein n=1 Tax=Nodosilinea sp. E11 TaxID=3037479 RepID=UPI002934F713|nr:hypothetical protein [Nodosilinea sp. E11]WOD39906.1 hypothetical protein RRF56_03770 [Nodosilinea sp. E11]